jgi:hypothetical protein
MPCIWVTEDELTAANLMKSERPEIGLTLVMTTTSTKKQGY